MIGDARKNLQGEHASNLGCAFARELASEYECPAYVVDPVSTDEMEPLARYSGHPSIERKSLSHALNIHAAARRAAHEMGLAYAASSFIVAHLGGGISVARVRNGNIVDVNDASSDGPFSPERTGGLPLQPVISLAFSGRMTEGEMRAMVMGKGGLAAYLGTKSAEEVEKRIQAGDSRAAEVFEAMAYQISKEIGAMAAALSGAVDGVVLTGGLAASARLMGWIKDCVAFIGPVLVYPGEHELQALAEGALRVLRGEEQAREY
jgi:butyrate kinase